MESMMKELEGLMESGDFEDMFGGLVNQLASRELLYEPMKDLRDKYPTWITENEAKITIEELTRFQNQEIIVKKIVQVFDKSQTDEPNEEEAKKIMDLMQEVVY
jgi:peroxin-19